MTFDNAKLAELKKVLAEKDAAFWETGKKIHDLTSKDGPLSDTDLEQHSRLANLHGVLDKEVKHLAADVERYEGKRPLTPEQQKSPSMLRRFLDKGVDGLEEWEIKSNIGEQNGRKVLKIYALATDTSQGENALPTDVAGGLVNDLKFYGGVQRMGSTITRNNGNPFVYPGLDDSTVMGTYAAQEAAVSEVDVGTISGVTVNAYTCNSGIIPIAREAVADIAFPIDREISERTRHRIGRRESLEMTTGTSSTAPTGVVGSGKGWNYLWQCSCYYCCGNDQSAIHGESGVSQP